MAIYIKSLKKDKVGISQLKCNGITACDNKTKANLLSINSMRKILMPYIPGLRMGSTNIMNDIYNLVKSMEARNQIDLILDFSKAFDSLPHEHLLRKLGISNKLHNWIRTWLAIIVKGLWLMGNVQTLYMCVRSIPGDPYLAPLMFLLYINDIGEGISLEIKLFADDCQLYREVNSMEDALVLQSDLDKLFTWSREWQMRFNPTKCYTLQVSRLSSLNV